jgi:hypothetical protein
MKMTWTVIETTDERRTVRFSSLPQDVLLHTYNHKKNKKIKKNLCF